MDNLYRVFRAAKKRQELTETMRAMFKGGVSCPVRDSVRLVCPGWERRGGPHFAGLLIAQIKRLTGWIQNRIMCPLGEAPCAGEQRRRRLLARVPHGKWKSRISNY